MNQTTRRGFLGTLGTASALGLAGCSGTSQLSGLKSRLSSADKREQRLHKKLNKTQAELNQTKAQLNQTQSKLDNVTTHRDELRANLYNERQQTKNLKNQLTTKNETIATLEEEVASKEKRLTKLESLVDGDEIQFGFTQGQIKTAKELGNELQKSVVRVKSSGDGPTGSGTAWHLGDGYYMTNGHVVANANKFKIISFDEHKSGTDAYPATLLGSVNQATRDMAILKSPYTDPPARDYADSTNLERGQPLVQVGHPFNVGSWVISMGPFLHYGAFTSSTSTAGAFTSFIPGESGNSGSPVITLDGTVVGMTYGGTSAVDKTVHAPDNVHTNFANYPEKQQHMHSLMFDRVIADWT